LSTAASPPRAGLGVGGRETSCAMSLLPAYFGARKRDDAPAPPTDESEDDQLRHDIFNLIPSRAANNFAPLDAPAAEAVEEAPAPKPIGRNKHPVDMTDLSRLSIDTDGHLYWDGKPVKARQQLAMSGKQILAAALIALFVIVGAVGAAIQGGAAAHEWACRLGLTKSYCGLPAATPAPRPRIDIPA
jgi:hypothetical protein